MARREATGAHECTMCGHAAPSWFGRCPECGAWSTAASPARAAPSGAGLVVRTLAGAGRDGARIHTGAPEADRVLGGGLVPGSVVLLAGEPGMGKSTLVLQLVAGLVEAGRRCLLVTGEESVDQVALRAARLGAPRERIRVAASGSLGAVLEASAREEPEVLVVDSIQTLSDEALEQSCGSVVQVRECAASLVRHAKSTGRAVVLVGHVTKDGSVAGPKTLEHVVDAIVTLEGERSGSLRLLRAVKNRFGSCEETGVFAMTAGGLASVPDPSSMLLSDRRPGPGSAVHAGLEGTRPVLVEMQALVVGTPLAQPRRVAIGIDQRRLAALLAVLAKTARDKLSSCDVFVSAVGGLHVREPAGDLAALLALASALDGAPVDPGLVAVGEIGLGGEVRRAPGMERRLAEAARLGFARALVPRASKATCPGVDTIGVADIGEAIDALTSYRVARSAGPEVATCYA
jgi:DNA repair protein RadA/Sms